MWMSLLIRSNLLIGNFKRFIYGPFVSYLIIVFSRICLCCRTSSCERNQTTKLRPLTIDLHVFIASIKPDLNQL